MLNSTVTYYQLCIEITNDLICEDLESFSISLTSLNDNCVIDDPDIPVYIVDDGEYL